MSAREFLTVIVKSESKKRWIPERREGKRPDSFKTDKPVSGLFAGATRESSSEQRSVQFISQTTTRYKNVKSSRGCPRVRKRKL